MNESDFKKARSLALKLLTICQKSQRDIEDKLKTKGFDKDVVSMAVEDLKGLGLIDDRGYALELARSKIKNRLWGINKVKCVLAEKGVQKEVIEDIVSEIRKEFDDEAVIKKALKKWAEKNRVGGAKDKARAFRHLLSKGFQTSLVYKVLNNYYKDRGEILTDDSI